MLHAGVAILSCSKQPILNKALRLHFTDAGNLATGIGAFICMALELDVFYDAFCSSRELHERA